MPKEKTNFIPSVPRESVATPEQARLALDLSEEKTKELRRDQDKALALFRSRARLSDLERRVGRGIELERHHTKTGNREALADALAMQGRFAEAVKASRDKDKKKVFREKIKAIDKADDDCPCPTYREENGLHLPNQHVESFVVSQKHGQVMPAIRCRVCGKLNVRANLPHLAEQRAARATSLANENRQIKAVDFFSEAR
jgi:hypothetical protein